MVYYLPTIPCDDTSRKTHRWTAVPQRGIPWPPIWSKASIKTPYVDGDEPDAMHWRPVRATDYATSKPTENITKQTAKNRRS